MSRVFPDPLDPYDRQVSRQVNGGSAGKAEGREKPAIRVVAKKYAHTDSFLLEPRIILKPIW